MLRIVLTIGAILMLWSSNATAQEKLAVGHCIADLKKLCPGIPPGKDNLRACMREHIRDVSFQCLVMLAKFAEVRRLHKECRAHLQQQCGSVERREGQFEACLRSAIGSLSDTCKDALARAVRRTRSWRRGNVDDNLGQSQTFAMQKGMSAGPRKAVSSAKGHAR
jgi:hypothetical protein